MARWYINVLTFINIRKTKETKKQVELKKKAQQWIENKISLDNLIQFTSRNMSKPEIEGQEFGELTKIPFGKNESLLVHLVVSAESHLEAKLWIRHEMLCQIVEEVLREFKHYLSHQTCEQILNYLTKVIEKSNQRQTVDCAWNAWLQFPFDEAHFSLPLLIDPLTNQLDCTEPNECEWNRHENICKVIMWVLLKYKDSLNHETGDRIFNYIMKLISKCDHDKIVVYAFYALTQMPFDKYQTLVLKLLDLMTNQMNLEEPKWNKHAKMCTVIGVILLKYTKYTKDKLDYQTYCQIIDYLMKLIEKCNDEKTIVSACEALKQFPFDKHHTSLLKLLDMLEYRTYYDEPTLNRCKKMCILFEKLLENFQDSLIHDYSFRFPRQQPVDMNTSFNSAVEKKDLISLQPELRVHIFQSDSVEYENEFSENSQITCPIGFSHKWIIENFYFNKSATPLSVLYSETFPVSDEIVFSLRLVPVYKDDNSYMSIFLYLERCLLQNCSSINVRFKITIVNIDPEKSLIKTKIQRFQLEQFWGWEKFIKRSDLLNQSSGFVVDKMFTILCEVEIENEALKIKSNQTENKFNCNLKVNQFDYYWEIEDFSSIFRGKFIDSQFFESDIFPSHNENAQNRYCLRLWPRGIDETAKDFVSIYLYLKESANELINLNYRFSILDLDGDVYHSGEGRGLIYPIEFSKTKISSTNIPSGKGSSRFIALERILNPENGLLSEDKLTIFCEIEELLEQEY